MSTEPPAITPRPTDEEAAAIAAALAILRQAAEALEKDVAPPSRWSTAARREALRDDR